MSNARIHEPTTHRPPSEEPAHGAGAASNGEDHDRASETTKTKPTATLRIGAMQAAIWRNTDTEGRSRFQTTFERLYRDRDGTWRSSASFGRDELLVLAKVADVAHTRVHELQAEDRERAVRDRARLQTQNGRNR